MSLSYPNKEHIYFKMHVLYVYITFSAACLDAYFVIFRAYDHNYCHIL
jgi:hypothetical protein